MRSSLYRVRKSRSLGNLIDRWMASHIARLSQRHHAVRKQRMAIFANDEIGVYINQFGYYEREQLDILFEFLAPLALILKKGTAFDIGANIGNHVVYFSSHFRNIHAFEPNPSTFELLSFNTKGLGSVTAHNVGLGDASGQFEMGESAKNVGSSSIKYSDHGDSIVKIQVERLDDLDLDVSRLCFIKLDVEGFEPNVIRGARRIIGECQPIIVFEQHAHEFVGGISETIALLHGAGYQLCWHQNGIASRNVLLRRMQNVRDIFLGRVHRIVHEDMVPVNTYPMLIAVPPRFRAALGLV